MKTIKWILCAALLASTSSAWAAGGSGPLYEAKIDLHSRASLQRGAALFVNYCLSCHSLAFSRYNRVATDLGIPEEMMKENMLFTGRKFGETMTVALREEQSKKWFGAPPPDLSVRTRARGVDWIYSYLKTFYKDDKGPRGVNNLTLPGTSMPHVLWELQGMQALVESTDAHAEDDQGGHGESNAPKFEIVSPGSMSPEEYDQAVADIVNFLAYVAEPARLQRQTLGVWVLLFLFGFGVVAYFLKKEYWKDVH